MIRPFLDDPLFGGIPGPGLTGSLGLTDITFAGQRHVMPLRMAVAKATGLDGISQQEEREMAIVKRALRMIYCGLCQCDHTPAEFEACLKNQAGR
jgi:hypothetical protein